MKVTREQQFLIEDLVHLPAPVRNLWLYTLAMAARNGPTFWLTNFFYRELFYLHRAAAEDLEKFIGYFMLEPAPTMVVNMDQLVSNVEEMLGLRPADLSDKEPPKIH